jgi:hypothetical protein
MLSIPFSSLLQGAVQRQLGTVAMFLGHLDFIVTLKGEKVDYDNGRDSLSNHISNEH